MVTAPYATPVLNGRPLVTPLQPPKTQMWFFIYGQVVQADARSMRNILLATSLGVFLRPIRDGLSSQISVLLKHFTGSTTQRDRTALAVFTQTEIATLLKAIHLPDSTPLSVLAVELLPGGTGSDVGSPQTAAGATVALSANIASTSSRRHVSVRAHPAGLPAHARRPALLISGAPQCRRDDVGSMPGWVDASDLGPPDPRRMTRNRQPGVTFSPARPRQPVQPNPPARDRPPPSPRGEKPTAQRHLLANPARPHRSHPAEWRETDSPASLTRQLDRGSRFNPDEIARNRHPDVGPKRRDHPRLGGANPAG